MSEIIHYLSIIANLASIILAIIGLFFVYKNWCIWKRLSWDILKARVFLNKKFLEKNWIYLVIVGGLIAFRRVYRFVELTTDLVENQIIEAFFDITGFIVIMLLVLMAYEWYKVIHTHSFSGKEP